MEIGEYLASVRKAKKYSLLTLAEKSGVHATQISRIERGENRPTIFSLVQLCHALDIDLPELLRKTGRAEGAIDLYLERQRATRSIYLTPEDIAAFLEKFEQDDDKDKALIDLTSPIAQVSRPELKGSHLPRETSFYKRFWLYPPTIDQDDIMQTYLRGGAVNLNDFGHMISLAREEKSYSVHRAAKEAGLDHEALQSIEQGENSRLIFDEIVELDNTLQSKGKLIALVWSAAEFIIDLITSLPAAIHIHYRVHKYSSEKNYANKAVNLSRWYQSMAPSVGVYRDWVTSLRDMLKKK